MKSFGDVVNMSTIDKVEKVEKFGVHAYVVNLIQICTALKMIARQKDTGFGWKLEDFKFRAAFTIVQHLHFFLNLKNRKKTHNIFNANDAYVIFKT
jgi:hypothetical protein